MSDPRHRWGEPRSVFDETPSGCEETERVCAHCGLVKITVHPPQGVPWRAWRTKEGMRAQLEHTPPCLAAIEPARAVETPRPQEVPFS